MKYSIIIPTLNSVTYVKDAIASIINQNFYDYELLISDNKSDDNTYEYVQSLSHERIRLIQPDTRLAMHDHWEFAFAHAKGDWITLCGSDDGLMPHFFGLAEHLTALAKEQNIEVIGSERAYYFWDGCQDVYGDLNVSYHASPRYIIRNSTSALLNCCIGANADYIELPHVYTSSIVHKNILEKIKKRQSAKLLSSLIPDACLACNIALMTDRYLHSSVPLGWVGSSNAGPMNDIARTGKVSEETLPYYAKPSLAWNAHMGSFGKWGINNFRFFLFESVLNSEVLPKNSFFYKILHSKSFMTRVFANLDIEINKQSNKYKEKEISLFNELLAINKISLRQINFTQKFILPSIHKYFLLSKEQERKKSKDLFPNTDTKPDQSLTIKHSETDCHSLMDAWNKINELNKQNAVMTK